jgi:hypothetical protein
MNVNAVPTIANRIVSAFFVGAGVASLQGIASGVYFLFSRFTDR